MREAPEHCDSTYVDNARPCKASQNAIVDSNAAADTYRRNAVFDFFSLLYVIVRHSDEPLIAIAERIGYLSDTAFSIAFKRTMGISPGRYRNEQREAALRAVSAR